MPGFGATSAGSHGRRRGRGTARRRRSTVLTLTLALAGGASGASPAEIDRIVEVLGLRPGMSVADVGAGDGDFTVELAGRVGADGRVFATEIEEDLVRDIRERAEGAGLGNVSVLLGDQGDTALAAGCCDAILLRMVYHHFQDPAAMRAGLRAALRPGGRIAVIDILPQQNWRRLSGVPDRGGHGIPPEDLVSEMAADGFEQVARYDSWGDEDDRFCVVFRKPAVPALSGEAPPP